MPSAIASAKSCNAGPHGIYSMLYAYFGRDGALDRRAMRAQLEGCLADDVHGIAILGLATEVRKLTADERRSVMDWIAEDLVGRLPLAVTIYEPDLNGQIAAARHAVALGASWLVLQPPPDPGLGQDGLIRYFGRVADAVACPVAIQNAPQWLGVGLEQNSIATLNRHHPNVSLMKAECSAVELEALHRATGGQLALFNGRGGLELIDVIRAGGVGALVAPESAGALARIFELATSPDGETRARGEALYAELLPLIVFLMQSLDALLCYGKRLAAQRFGIAEVQDRPPVAVKPTDFGMATLRHHARVLDRFAVPSAMSVCAVSPSSLSGPESHEDHEC